MTQTPQSLIDLAALCGVSVADARLFVELVYHGTKEGLTLEAAIERGRTVIVQVLDNLQRYPQAGRAFVVECYDDLREVAQ